MNRRVEAKGEASSDEALALALQQGDESAFEELVARHQSRVYAVAYRMSGNREDALDIAQESFLKMYRRIHVWRPTGRFSGWLMRLTTNQSLDHLRRRKRFRPDRVRVPEATHTVERWGRDPETQDPVRAREIADRVQESLDVLSPMQRLVFVLRHFEGQSVAEIASVAGCSEGSVKVHLHRALRKLRGPLSDLIE